MYNRKHFSRQELQILDRLVEGETNREIARHLKISEASVKKGLCALNIKLATCNRVQIAITAIVFGLAYPQFNELSQHYKNTSFGPRSALQQRIPDSSQSTYTRITIKYELPSLDDKPLWTLLTSRELDVFRIFGEANVRHETNSYLAKHLGIAPATFRQHLRKIYKKLNCNTRIQLIDLANEEKKYRNNRS